MRFAPVDVDTVRDNRGWFVALGLAEIALGILAIVLPIAAARVTTIVLGWLIVLAGLSEAFHARRNRGWGGAGWELLSAAVQVVAGLVLVLLPTIGKLALMLILAAYLIGEGALKLIRAAQHRRIQASGWLVFDGILSFALGVVILAGGLGTALWVLGVLVGIHLLTGGMSMLLIALGAGRAQPV